MIRLFQTWRAARRKKMCDLVAQIWAECEAELLAEIEAAKQPCYYCGGKGYDVVQSTRGPLETDEIPCPMCAVAS